MLSALPTADGSFTATLFLPQQGAESFESLTTPEAVHALFERRFADAIPLMPRLAEDFFANPTGHLETIRCEPWSFEDQALRPGRLALERQLAEDFFANPTGHLETIRCEPWSFEDHALVLGDAAHAIVPFHGQ